MTTIDFANFEKKISVEFKDKSLLKQAFIHRSYINENKNLNLDHNERLEFLGDAVLELEVNDFLLLSRGETKDVGRARQYILANTLEAIIGAIYLDQGYDMSKIFISNHILPLITDVIKTGTWIDAKSLFQEKAQEVVGITPAYKTIREEGPDHDKHFTVGVYLNNELVVVGDGKSKQEAEQTAARNALQKKGWE